MLLKILIFSSINKDCDMPRKKSSSAQKKQQAKMKSAVREAKKYYKAHPNVKWSTALKEGWKHT